MNYISVAEEYLRNYGLLQGSVDTMRDELKKLIRQSGPAGDRNMAIKIDPESLSLGAVTKGGGSEFDETVNLLWKIGELRGNIAETEAKLQEVDVLLEDIAAEADDDRYSLILRLWYMDKLPKEQIAEEVGYASLKQVYALRNKAIRAFAIRILGIRALEAL